MTKPEAPTPRGRAALLQRLMQSKVGEPSPAPAELQPHPSASRTELPQITKKVEELKIADKPPKEEPEREPLEYKGVSGKQVPATANYISLHLEKGRGVFEYEVKFVPDVDSKSARFRMLNSVISEFCKAKTFDGHVLYLPSRLIEVQKDFSCKHPFNEEPVQMSIIYKKQKRMSDCIHLYNVLFKRIMHVLSFMRVGRQFFDNRNPCMIPQHKLEIWPGYVTAVNEYSGGIMLCLDVQHRVLRTQNALEVILNIIEREKQRYKQVVEKTMIGSSVLTRYNNKTYIIDDIMWDANPTNKFETSDGGEISFLEYYKKQYNLVIREREQPMLVNRQSIVSGEAQTRQDRIILLVPELCYMTGLTDEMRADFRIMKDIAQFTRVTPNQRMNGLRKFVNSVNTNSQASEILSAWGLSLHSATIDLQMRVLDPECIIFGNNVIEPGSMKADWTSAAMKNRVITSIDIRTWLVLYTAQDKRNVEEFLRILMRLGPKMGIEINRPALYCMPDDRNETYVKVLREHIKPELQLICIVCPTSRDDRYSTIKKVCCATTPIPSQVINSRTLRNTNPQSNKLNAIAQKIALQMNCKLGGTLWSVRFPFKRWMICGIDVYHSKTGGSPAVCGFVSSINEIMAKWFSTCQFHEKNKEIGDHIKPLFFRALQEYYSANAFFPTNVVIYRDGVGDGQMDTCTKFEIMQLQNAIRESGHDIKLTYIVVQKRINTRIFMKQNEENPPPGSIVDTTIMKRNFYDFFLVAQQVRQGTVTPTHYVVLHDDAKIKADYIQRLSYKMCHMYYNWTGTIRVPAPCQYAHKLAYLVGQNVRQEPSKKLSNTLFYL
ncbi:Argonaute 3 [Carabus blaptoides fortunei]